MKRATSCIVCKKPANEKGRTCSSDKCIIAYEAYLRPSSVSNALIVAQFGQDRSDLDEVDDGIEEDGDEDPPFPEEAPYPSTPLMRPGREVPVMTEYQRRMQ